MITAMATLIDTSGGPGPQPARRRRPPPPRRQEHAAKAATPDEQLAVACDRLRAQIARLRKPGRDPQVRDANTARADHLATEAAQVLHEMCERAGEGGAP